MEEGSPATGNVRAVSQVLGDISIHAGLAIKDKKMVAQAQSLASALPTRRTS